jgi:spoIIIJ-associated protein
LEERIEIAKELMIGLLERMGMEKQIDGFSKEGDVFLEIKGDEEGILIGKHGRTLDSLQVLINRMVNKRLKTPVRVVLDIDDYRKRRADTLTRMAIRLGEKVKRMGYAVTLGPFSAHDRRTIHIALKDDPFVRTESFGEGETKKITIIPERREEKRSEPLE